MARKYSNAGMMRPAREAAALNLRTTAAPAGMRVPPRARKIPVVCRRLPVLMTPEAVQPVIIRHAGQNLGSAAIEPRLRPVSQI